MQTWLRVAVAGAAVGIGAYAGHAVAGAGTTPDGTSITVWRGGGVGYGGYTGTTSGAYVVERRTMDVPANGELRLPGVSTMIDAGTVQLRSASDPGGTAVVEQRMIAGGATPDALLGRRIGKSITVVTDRGEVSGILRAFDSETLVVEVGSGKDVAVEILRRGEHVIDIKLPIDQPVLDQPTLVWRVTAQKPGPQPIEVSYRTDGLSWEPDYSAVYDESKGTVDFSAWATVSNGTGAEWKDVELTLASGDATETPVPGAPARATTQASFKVPRRVHVGVGETIQVELMPAKKAASSRKVIVVEPVPDQSAQYQAYPAQECYAYAAPGQGAKADVALEVDTPGTQGLPEGRVRLLRKNGDRLEVGGEDTLRVNAATQTARIRLANAPDVSSEAKQVDCRFDDRARQLHERVEVKLENHGKAATDAVLRVFMYRWPQWKIEAEDEKGTRAGAQVQEYRVRVPAGGSKTLTYAVVYSW
ncbi:MAG TPA: DUF4139 domain-containing protein [Kofleriaceae bacterium]|nr:DUF4139 domain-containing protein [Kofleriaceae bacterium]